MNRVYLTIGVAIVSIAIVATGLVTTYRTLQAQDYAESKGGKELAVWSREEMTEDARHKYESLFLSGMKEQGILLQSRANYLSALNLLSQCEDLSKTTTIVQSVRCSGSIIGIMGFPRSKENCRLVLMFMDKAGDVVIYRHRFPDDAIEHYFIQTMYPAKLVTVESLVAKSKKTDDGYRVLNEGDFDDSLKLRVPYDTESVLAIEMPDGLLSNWCTITGTGSDTLEDKYRWVQEREQREQLIEKEEY